MPIISTSDFRVPRYFSLEKSSLNFRFISDINTDRGYRDFLALVAVLSLMTHVWQLSLIFVHLITGCTPGQIESTSRANKGFGIWSQDWHQALNCMTGRLEETAACWRRLTQCFAYMCYLGVNIIYTVLIRSILLVTHRRHLWREEILRMSPMVQVVWLLKIYQTVDRRPFPSCIATIIIWSLLRLITSATIIYSGHSKFSSEAIILVTYYESKWNEELSL